MPPDCHSAHSQAAGIRTAYYAQTFGHDLEYDGIVRVLAALDVRECAAVTDDFVVVSRTDLLDCFRPRQIGGHRVTTPAILGCQRAAAAL